MSSYPETITLSFANSNIVYGLRHPLPPIDTLPSDTIADTIAPPIPEDTLPADTLPRNSLNIGTNLSEYRFWQDFVQTNNKLKSVRIDPATDRIIDTEEPLQLDPLGYPIAIDPNAQYDRVRMAIQLDPRYDSGNYELTYDGSASNEFAFRGGITLTGSEPNKLYLRIDASQLVEIFLTKIDSNDYFRNAKLYKVGDDPDGFNSLWLDHLKPMGKCLRFMDWQLTNLTQQKEWSDRALPGKLTYFKSKGVPLEVMIDLCVQTGADGYFCIPHLASDNYIENFAQTLLDNFPANQDIYLESSNEYWNDQFPQAKWINNQAQALNVNASGGVKEHIVIIQQFAKMVNAVKRVMGGDPRLKFVLAGKAKNPDNMEKALDLVPLDSLLDSSLASNQWVFAIAPYFGSVFNNIDRQARKQGEFIDNWAKTEEWANTLPIDQALDNVFEELFNGGLLPSPRRASQAYESFTNGAKKVGDRLSGLEAAKQSMVEWRELGDLYEVKVIAYEGGQHLNSRRNPLFNQKVANMMIAANRDPRMDQAYRQYLSDWEEVMGNNLFCHFLDFGQYTKAGSWGITEFVDDTSPKYEAVKALVKV